MPTGYNEELKRDFYRDLAAKQHLAARLARSGRVSACDELATETAVDYCARMLKKLGLPDSRDPVMAITMFLAGHDSAVQQATGMDSADAPDWFTELLNS
jgi:transcription initiation factor TFIIIB Brf1 subunit/transcription initiation factor TFIIB